MTDDTAKWLKKQGAPEIARYYELIEKYGQVPMMDILEKFEELEEYIIKLKLASWAVIDTEGVLNKIVLEDWEEEEPWQKFLEILREKPEDG